jgi:TRAP transporter TAXI family solute receptor
VVTVLMPLRTTFFVKKDSPIKSISDLKGKNVPGVFTSQKVVGIITRGMLANAGLSYDDVKMVPVNNVVRGADDFARGKTDAFFFAVGSGKILQTSARVGGIRALSLDPSPEAMARLNKVFPVGYALKVAPRKQNHGILTPTYVNAFDLVFLTNSKVSDEVIYKVTRTLHGGKKAMFATFRPLGAMFSPKRMAKKLVAGEYHPGAVKFYKEMGMWPPK